jgi:hypothetical protein
MTNLLQLISEFCKYSPRTNPTWRLIMAAKKKASKKAPAKKKAGKKAAKKK